MVSALGMSRGGSSRGGGDRLAYFVSQKTLEPFVNKELLEVTAAPIRFKTPRGQMAYGYEVLCKVLCHNICVIIQGFYEFGITPNFGAEARLALKSVEK